MTKARKYVCECELIEKEWLNASYYRLRFNSPEISSISNPGQFVNIRLSNTLDPLLRRPMSIYRCNKEEKWFEVLIKIVGKGTLFFSNAKPGDKFDIIGPLGIGFNLKKKKNAILIGGGIGVAPLVFLAEEKQKVQIDTIFVLGFQNVDEVCCLSQIKPYVKNLFVSTDDGSYGKKGLVTNQLSDLLQEQPELSKSEVFACGPNPMMFALEIICNAYKMDAQFSLEAHMACGFGVCVGCAVPKYDRDGFYLVCDDGPVFNKGEVYLGS